ncbi:hypothetical protein [Ottowia sp.]|uniref:hypothetical protein n=1 Tax=Ottowia sp. TaxID=1898956 RepID=UPI0025D0DE31|nr:hypothetical protein [Ottowia sp.]MBK6616582.1 hypothetical protein [Ottowia sp.]
MKMLMDPTMLQWCGCVTALMGSLLLAVKGRFAGFGFVLYLASNGLWALFGVVTNAPAIVVMQTGFGLTSLIGIWQWVVVPARIERSRTASPRLLRVPRHQSRFASGVRP